MIIRWRYVPTRRIILLIPIGTSLRIQRYWATVKIPFGNIAGIRSWSILFLLSKMKLTTIDLINNILLFKIPTLLDCMIPSTKYAFGSKPLWNRTLIGKVSLTSTVMTPHVMSLFWRLRSFRPVVGYFD